MTAIISNGISDTQLYLQAAANVKPAFNVTPSSGQYPAVGNVLVNRRLASQWQLLYLDQKIFTDGLGVTSMNATEDGAVAVRIPRLIPAPRNMRTLSVNLGGHVLEGTPGNDSPFNNNLPHGMQTDAVDIFFRQIYDEAGQVSRSQMRMIGSQLDLLAQYTQNIPQVVAMLTDADIMGNHIGAGLARAKRTSNSNVVFYNKTNTDKGYLQNVMNALATKLSNVPNGYVDGVVSYPVEKSVFVLKYSVFNKLMTVDNGAIINSDIGQKILLRGKFSDDNTRYLGGCIRGEYGGIMIKVVPDEYWTMAAALDGVPVANLSAFNKVVGYVANGLGVYFGRSSTDVEVDKAPTTSMGYIVRNDWQWGAQVIRDSAIALLVESANDGADFVNPIETYSGTVSPRDLEAYIQSYQAAIPAAGTIQAIGIASESLVTDVKLTLNTGSQTPTPVKNATLTIVGDGFARYSFGNNGDGTYDFTLPRGVAATVTVEAPGMEKATVEITEDNTALATYSVTKTLTAE